MLPKGVCDGLEWVYVAEAEQRWLCQMERRMRNLLCYNVYDTDSSQDEATPLCSSLGQKVSKT